MTSFERRFIPRLVAIRTIQLAALALALQAATARAEQVIFSIDHSQSTFSVVINDQAFGTTFAQPGGSDSSDVSGHFLIDFDPTTSSPAAIQFLNGSGYITLDNTGIYQPFGTPGMLGLQTTGGNILYTFRNLVWDWSSPSAPLTSGNFDSGALSYHVLSGTQDYIYGGQGPFLDDATGGSGQMQPVAQATFNETAPGDWTVSFTNQLVTNYSFGPPFEGTITYLVNLVANAHFDTDNIVEVSSGTSQQTAVNGGATETGGIDLTFDEVVTGGTLTAQAIDNTGGLTLEALEALADVTNFQLAGGDAPQLWDISFDGEFTGIATLVFNYDPNLVGTGALSILHFNDTLGAWEDLGGIVDTVAHTITIETTSFSPFALVETVPEPSTLVLAALAAGALAVVACRRKNGR